jgi:murein DD-endopeptidase MepM/ murein hydrolase activator NlpD
MSPKFLMIALAAAVMPIRSLSVAGEARRAPTLLPPVSPACISSSFGPRVLSDHPAAGSYHYGVDLPAPVGSAVFATAPGTVVRVQRKGPGGLEMLVQHDGFLGIYSHFGMIMPAFAEGKRTVATGEKLGVVGRTGVTSGAHLFFGMVLAGRPVDPAQYLDVPFCSAGVRRTQPDRADDEGIAFGGKRYYQVFLPEQHQH